MKNVLLVVGNGFDLNLGLKTSYKDFINSINLPNNIKLNFDLSETIPKKINILNTDLIEVSENNLIRELINLHVKNNWVDIEQELGNFARGYFSTQEVIEITSDYKVRAHSNELILKEYVELKQVLKEYLTIQNTKFKDGFNIDYNDTSGLYAKYNEYENNLAFRELERLFEDNTMNLTVLNFNYTDTVEICAEFIFRMNKLNQNIIQKDFGNEYKKKLNQILVHGSINDEIVFGIDDREEIKKEYRYLHKSFDENTTCVNIGKLLEDSEEIVFFGYSLGVTDESYFEDFFHKICLFNRDEKSDQKAITFYYFKKDGYIELFDRLVSLTDKSTAKLRQYNNITFKDSSIVFTQKN